MYNHLMFLAYWVINAIILYLASLLLPNNVVLGSWRFNTIEASIYASFWLTFLIWVFWDFAIAKKFGLKKGVGFFVYFFIINCVSVWIVARFSSFTGFELINDQWVLLIGLAAAILQKIPWKLVGRKV